MGFPLQVFAQVQIDFPTDSIVGDSFGFDLTSLTVLVANQTYTISLDEDAQLGLGQVQVIHSPVVAPGGFPAAEGPLLCLPLVGPPVGIAIQSTSIAGAPAPSVFTHQLTYIRVGVVS